ncbi:glycoside hydrolase family 13 protein [Paenibacillus wulumuqiensis]|uniref:glycoside hydrolase family 13 protein n=1 Tax=Paenibacillus wulumuqiensis TaxID=1567107 RepID=UPI000619C643|nr:alpha-glucosidase [Paenibacillus wulumuqiensis]
MNTVINPEYWKESIVYEVYLRSFQDSNGDGIGDIPGVISRLDYLKELGVDVVWISPVHPSPNADYSYDIKDFYSIDPVFGTLDDLKQLIHEVHKRDMKMIMDMIINHTSDEHPWFLESRSSVDSPYRDYYFWRDPAPDGGPPSNWISYLGESMWEYDETTKQYYLHSYHKKEPDLNWENPRVRQEMKDIMHHWLKLGIDGYQIDAVNSISKDTRFPNTDDTERRQANAEQYFKEGPRVHEYLHELYEDVFAHYSIFTAGEPSGIGTDEAALYTHPDRQELDMVLMMEASKIDTVTNDLWQYQPWTLQDLKKIMGDWNRNLYGKGWIGVYLSSHDHARLVSYLGDADKYHKESAKLLAMFLMTMQGTPYIYQGDEIGMTNAQHLRTIDDFTEQQAKIYYRQRVEEHGDDEQEIMQRIYTKSRDHARTPVQWEDGPNGGFSTGEPWMPVNPNTREINVRQQQDDPDSILNFYREIIRIRKQHKTLVYGNYEDILPEDEQIYAYTRAGKEDRWLIVLNFSSSPADFRLPDADSLANAELMLHTHPDRGADPSAILSGKQVQLQPYEALLFSQKHSSK